MLKLENELNPSLARPGPRFRGSFENKGHFLSIKSHAKESIG